MAVKLQAPIELELKISIIDKDGHQGVATVSLARGRYTDEAEIRECVAKFERESMPDGFRLMTKREWFNSIFGQAREEEDDGEVIYMDYAMPGGGTWDA